MQWKPCMLVYVSSDRKNNKSSLIHFIIVFLYGCLTVVAFNWCCAVQMIASSQSYLIVLFGTINTPKNLVIIALIHSARWEWMTYYWFIVYCQHTSYNNTTKIVLLPCVCAHMYVPHTKTKTQYNYEWKWILTELYCSILICCSL